ncbi:MAG TPA: SurA N-terminal domain-containing protein [Dehalococcoidia bacterium]|nr:SurA N-terminal domain-containing protein [Dehalococcoidia bacterium]
MAEQDTEKSQAAGSVGTAQETQPAPAVAETVQMPAAEADGVRGEPVEAIDVADGSAEAEPLDEPPAEDAEANVADEALAVEYAPEDEEATLGEDGELVEERVVVVRRGVFYALAGIAALAIIALAVGNIYQWRANSGSAAVATVNGSKITRAEYDKAVAQGDGGDILDNLISKRLVEDDAAKRHITATPDEIDAKIRDTKAQLGSEAQWQQALAAQHLTELEARDLFRIEILLDKLTADKAQVTQADIQQYFDQNKDTQFQGKTIDQVQDQIKQQLTSDKQQQARSDYLTSLKNNARIVKKLPGA